MLAKTYQKSGNDFFDELQEFKKKYGEKRAFFVFYQDDSCLNNSFSVKIC